jgi:tetratricopeptide (TPR) repeat protein
MTMLRRAMVLVLLLATVSWGRAAIERTEMEAGKSLLYLPNGKYLKTLSMGHPSVLADWMYIWAIQYYSNYDRADRFRYIEHVFSGVIAELDPHYVDSYWLGALILSVEAKDLDAALRLLDQGSRLNPDEWVLPYIAAWECYYAGRFEAAETYFRLAAERPDAPTHVRRMQIGMIGRQGDLDRAIESWEEVRQDAEREQDGAMLAISERQLRTLLVERDAQALEQAVETYRLKNGRRPESLQVLVREKWISHLPSDPDGQPYRYQPKTGRVDSSAGRLLGDR